MKKLALWEGAFWGSHGESSGLVWDGICRMLGVHDLSEFAREHRYIMVAWIFSFRVRLYIL